MKAKLTLSGLIGAAILLPAFAQAANLVDNGSFATGTRSGWTLTRAESSSDFSVGQPAAGLPAAPSTFVAFFGAYGTFDDTISQSLSTTPGKTYDVTFSLLMAPGSGGDFSAKFGGTQILSLANPGSDVWQTYSFDETATKSHTLLSFSGLDGPGYNELTGISVMSVSAVPEPDTYLLILVGAGMLGLALRKRVFAAEPAGLNPA
jgi:PEP-CTERM motif-containing protein